MNDSATTRIELIFQVASGLLLTASIIITLMWIAFADRLNLEPYLVLLGLLYTAVPLVGRWVIRKLNRNVRTEQLTVTYTLAYGYLHNYLAPVVRRLRKELADPDKLKIYVYIPRFLSQLDRQSIDELLTELEKRSYEIRTVELSSRGNAVEEIFERQESYRQTTPPPRPQRSTSIFQ